MYRFWDLIRFAEFAAYTYTYRSESEIERCREKKKERLIMLHTENYPQHASIPFQSDQIK